ncbi:hypothetical protein HOO54_11715 [Bacillus sp. WMMC1349]|nr:hypothetical protein [Bacillus sp. WMMC1349]NPC92877.1 hypothetical protein [Bacillus sp. WMMC1349]
MKKSKLVLGILSGMAILTLLMNFTVSSDSNKVAGKAITSSIIESNSELA